MIYCDEYTERLQFFNLAFLGDSVVLRSVSPLDGVGGGRDAESLLVVGVAREEVATRGLLHRAKRPNAIGRRFPHGNVGTADAGQVDLDLGHRLTLTLHRDDARRQILGHDDLLRVKFCSFVEQILGRFHLLFYGA